MGVLTISIDVAYIIATLFLFKYQFTRNYEKVFYPYLNNKFLITSAAILCILKFIDIVEGYNTLHSSSFDFMLIVTVIVFFRIRKKYRVRVSLGFTDKVESFIDIPTTHYISVAQGVMDRGLEDKDDFKYEHENIFKPYVKDIDFNEWDVIFVFFEDSAKFESHFHSTDEEIQIIEGAALCLDEKTLISKNESIFIPRKTTHIFYGVEKGAALVKIKRQNKYLNIL